MCLEEIREHLETGLLPFWLNNSIDREFGGYTTSFDRDGLPAADTDKYIVTQTRMIWGFSTAYRYYKDKKFLAAAAQGVDFLIQYFWDNQQGGWYWKVNRSGKCLDAGKVVYGQIFAIYALSEYTMATEDVRGLEYAKQTFDLLQKYCTDTTYGGYYENLERDWMLSGAGFEGGDIKSLDIHMHIMEAYTNLYLCSHEEIHKRKLKEVIEVIVDRMMDMEAGCGRNQFNRAFEVRPPRNIRRTWNAEREVGEALDKEIDSTSYGHNLEFVWLLQWAQKTIGEEKEEYDILSRKLLEHCLQYGYDKELGGVFRDGPHQGKPLVRDKEWWQNCEVLVGFLEGYERFADVRYREAFQQTWQFISKFMINHTVGEWKQLLNCQGEEIIGNIGNPWKGMYHTGRAMMECMIRLDRMISKKG